MEIILITAIPMIVLLVFVVHCLKTDWQDIERQNQQSYVDGYLSGNGYLVTWAFGHLV